MRSSEYQPSRRPTISGRRVRTAHADSYSWVVDAVNSHIHACALRTLRLLSKTIPTNIHPTARSRRRVRTAHAESFSRIVNVVILRVYAMVFLYAFTRARCAPFVS